MRDKAKILFLNSWTIRSSRNKIAIDIYQDLYLLLNYFSDTKPGVSINTLPKIFITFIDNFSP